MYGQRSIGDDELDTIYGVDDGGSYEPSTSTPDGTTPRPSAWRPYIDDFQNGLIAPTPPFATSTPLAPVVTTAPVNYWPLILLALGGLVIMRRH